MSRLFHFILLLLLLGASVPVAAQQDTEVLVGDEPTSTAWTMIRFRLQTHTADLRSAIRTDEYEAFRTTIDRLREDLALYGRIAGAIAPDDEWQEIKAALTRTERLLDNFERDVSVGTLMELSTSARLLEETLLRIEELSVLTDIHNTGLPDPRTMALPPDWGELRYGDESMRGTLTLMNAREIASETRRRWRWLREENRGSLKPDAGVVARELGELGRALVLRQGELPDLMRPGYRNAALQVEVVAENLADYHRAGDRHRFRQQVELLGEALGRVQEYLDMRDRGN
ncbi:MAG: hypothetical protein PWP23_1805 [Candidatus Sumerlaeota bacterium]|nr:hypothetical protein [Candidatus Sumerlaeota bacterium]